MLVILTFSLLCLLAACSSNNLVNPKPTAPNIWGPTLYQVDVVHQQGATAFYAEVSADSQLMFTPDPVDADLLPFRFYEASFDNFREIIISSPYPIRSNWFRIAMPGCLDMGNTQTGVEFAISVAREKDYLLIARLDNTYWECLRSSIEPIHFSFQVHRDRPIPPTRFLLKGFYDLQFELLYLKAQRNTAGGWIPTPDYQLHQNPGNRHFSMRILHHPLLPPGQSLLRIGSSVQFLPESVWIGLQDKCLEEADWEVHRNRLADQFLLDVIIHDCYLNCLQNVADGFEFELEFFQFIP